MDTHKLNDAATDSPAATPRKLKVATVSLAGCLAATCPFLDIDERILPLLELVEFDRSPLTTSSTAAPATSAPSKACNAENVHVLREFRANCKVLTALGACAVNGGLPAQRNHLELADILQMVYRTGHGLRRGQRHSTTRSCRYRSTRCIRCTRW